MINALNYRSLHKFRLYFLLFRICFEMSKLWFYDLLTGYWCKSGFLCVWFVATMGWNIFRMCIVFFLYNFAFLRDKYIFNFQISNRFWKIIQKKYVIIFCIFSCNPYLKTDGAIHLILFSVKDSKQESVKKTLNISTEVFKILIFNVCWCFIMLLHK